MSIKALQRVAALLAVVVASCRDTNDLTGPRSRGSPGLSASTSIASTKGVRSFAFLPPLGAADPKPGNFDATLSPIVEVCQLAGASCGSVVARFARVAGGTGVLLVSTDDRQYATEWRVSSSLNTAVDYRVRVLLDGSELGHVDVDLVATGSERPRAGLVGVVAGSALPIKFRIGKERLAGDATALSGPAIPRKRFLPRAEDYSTTHPALPGIPLSFNTLLIVFKPQATVAEVNQVLDALDADLVGGIPGTTSISGIMFLRLPTTSHQDMESRLKALRANAQVKSVVQDGLLRPDVVSKDNGGTPVTWVWDVSPSGGNWGLERIRVPQMWNLNDGISKAGGAIPLTGVLDLGFVGTHPDLVYQQNLTANYLDDHGVHVAGIIGATVNNGVGVDGLNPFARLIVYGPQLGGNGPFTAQTTMGEQMIDGLYDIVTLNPALRVVNTSLGYNWGEDGINANTSSQAQTIADAQGDVFAQMVTLLSVHGPLPVFVTSAGNDSDEGFGMVVAVYNSPMTNAAIRLGLAPIIVVESVQNSLGSPGDAMRSAFSNIGGHVSAPGSQIVSTTVLSYASKSGTSMAAPHVTGLVGYLYTLDPGLLQPTLTTNPIRDLLIHNVVAVANGARPRIDAFATALDVDRVTGSDRVLRMLVDLDDGTADGNLRVDASGAIVTTEDADNDGGIGDGKVDMSDFRRWRDGFLYLDNPAGLALDGAPDHPKKDLNKNGVVTAADERIYPRVDLNGDGKVTLNDPVFVAGRIGRQVTDLQVLEDLFQDPYYAAADLPNLVYSGDLHLDAAN
jgi:subtilisin family serine protease